MAKKIYTIQAILSIVLGIFLILSTKIRFIGAVAGTNEVSASITIIFGIFFLLAGALLLTLVLLRQQKESEAPKVKSKKKK